MLTLNKYKKFDFLKVTHVTFTKLCVKEPSKYTYYIIWLVLQGLAILSFILVTRNGISRFGTERLFRLVIEQEWTTFCKIMAGVKQK